MTWLPSSGPPSGTKSSGAFTLFSQLRSFAVKSSRNGTVTAAWPAADARMASGRAIEAARSTRMGCTSNIEMRAAA
jgi:hypothetical protein